MSQFINLIGRRFGRWLAISRRPTRYIGKSGQTYYLCRCECGVEKEINSRYLREGRTKSCGCYEKEEAIKRMCNNNPMKNSEIAKKAGNARKEMWDDPNSVFNSDEYRKKQIENSYWKDKIRPDMSERMRGENNPMFGKGGELSPVWNGGISFEPYSAEFNKNLKRQIRERDNYTCQLCKKFGNFVHHIDYNKKNCSPDNLITLCNSDSSKVNSNRDQWETGFKIFMGGSYKRLANEILQ